MDAKILGDLEKLLPSGRLPPSNPRSLICEKPQQSARARLMTLISRRMHQPTQLGSATLETAEKTTYASADLRSAPSNFGMHGPGFEQAVLAGTLIGSPQIRGCRERQQRVVSPPKLSIYLHSVFQFGFALSRTLTQSYRPCMKFLFVTWRVLARMRFATEKKLPTYRRIRRLPLHGLLPPRSCPRLVLISSKAIHLV